MVNPNSTDVENHSNITRRSTFTEDLVYYDSIVYDNFEMISKLLGLFVLLQCFRYGMPIHCYECNSANNSMCVDPTIYDKETLDKFLKVTDCNQHFTQGQELFCRKIVQTILHKKHLNEVRVTRGCGYVRHRRECYKADNEDHLETVCQCFSDHCNGAPAAAAVGALVAIGLCLLM